MVSSRIPFSLFFAIFLSIQIISCKKLSVKGILDPKEKNEMKKLLKLQMPNTCPVGTVEPIWEDDEVTESYCRCPNGSYGFTCTEKFVNPCSSGIYHRPDPAIPRNYFIECTGNIPYLMKCAPGTKWNQRILTCDWDQTLTSGKRKTDPGNNYGQNIAKDSASSYSYPQEPSYGQQGQQIFQDSTTVQPSYSQPLYDQVTTGSYGQQVYTEAPTTTVAYDQQNYGSQNYNSNNYGSVIAADSTPSTTTVSYGSNGQQNLYTSTVATNNLMSDENYSGILNFLLNGQNEPSAPVVKATNPMQSLFNKQFVQHIPVTTQSYSYQQSFDSQSFNSNKFAASNSFNSYAQPVVTTTANSYVQPTQQNYQYSYGEQNYGSDVEVANGYMNSFVQSKQQVYYESPKTTTAYTYVQQNYGFQNNYGPEFVADTTTSTTTVSYSSYGQQNFYTEAPITTTVAYAQKSYGSQNYNSNYGSQSYNSNNYGSGIAADTTTSTTTVSYVYNQQQNYGSYGQQQIYTEAPVTARKSFASQGYNSNYGVQQVYTEAPTTTVTYDQQNYNSNNYGSVIAADTTTSTTTTTVGYAQVYNSNYGSQNYNSNNYGSVIAADTPKSTTTVSYGSYGQQNFYTEAPITTTVAYAQKSYGSQNYNSNYGSQSYNSNNYGSVIAADSTPSTTTASYGSYGQQNFYTEAPATTSLAYDAGQPYGSIFIAETTTVSYSNNQQQNYGQNFETTAFSTQAANYFSQKAEATTLPSTTTPDFSQDNSNSIDSKSNGSNNEQSLVDGSQNAESQPSDNQSEQKFNIQEETTTFATTLFTTHEPKYITQNFDRPTPNNKIVKSDIYNYLKKVLTQNGAQGYQQYPSQPLPPQTYPVPVQPQPYPVPVQPQPYPMPPQPQQYQQYSADSYNNYKQSSYGYSQPSVQPIPIVQQAQLQSQAQLIKQQMQSSSLGRLILPQNQLSKGNEAEKNQFFQLTIPYNKTGNDASCSTSKSNGITLDLSIKQSMLEQSLKSIPQPVLKSSSLANLLFQPKTQVSSKQTGEHQFFKFDIPFDKTNEDCASVPNGVSVTLSLNYF